MAFQNLPQEMESSIYASPHHSSSNGQAKRAVQTFQLGIKKQSTGTLQSKLSHFLFHYRLTLYATTGVLQAELLLNRQPYMFTCKLCCAQSERSGITEAEAQDDRSCTNHSFQ